MAKLTFTDACCRHMGPDPWPSAPKGSQLLSIFCQLVPLRAATRSCQGTRSSRAAPWQLTLRSSNGAPEGRKSVCVLRTSTTSHPHTLSALSGSQHLQTGHLCHHGGCPEGPAAQQHQDVESQARSRVARLAISICRGHHDAMVSEVDGRDQVNHWTNHDRSFQTF